jgi:hypothetical protein
MKDLFGNTKPVAIEVDEWWFNGRIIQKQNDCRLPNWISFADDGSQFVEVHSSKKDAVDFCLKNPCKKPNHLAQDYIAVI